MIGFETIGNATVTVFDNNPILTTDPGYMEILTLEVGDINTRFQENKFKILKIQSLFFFLMDTLIILIQIHLKFLKIKR